MAFFTRTGQPWLPVSYYGSIKLWDLATGATRTTLEGRSNECVAFSPDGTMFATSQYKSVNLYDMSHGRHYRFL